MGILLLDSENADRDLKTAAVTVLTHTPHATNHVMCAAHIALGDGAKNLDGTGGDFQLTITVGGQTVEPNPQVVTFSTAVRVAVWTGVFPVPAAKEVIIKVLSPNAADDDVDVTCYLFDMAPIAVGASGEVLTLTTYTGNTPQTGDLYLIGKSGGDGDLEAILDELTAGVSLAAGGLDAIPVTDPAGVATTFPQMLVQVWRRFFKRHTMTATELKTYADDDETANTTQALTDDETTQDVGPAA
jgi:hypothetical protein